MVHASQWFDYILHIDVYLNLLIYNYGLWLYGILFLIIFCETGLVITPFLPGDSLLFATGSLAAQTPQSLNVMAAFIILLVASILGNQLNFCIGKFIGPRVLMLVGHSKYFNKKHLDDTQQFYLKYGGNTLIFARFLPIIRTFAPFIAGITRMPILLFCIYNVLGAILWIGSLVGLGYFLGSIPIVKNNFTMVIYIIIACTLIPTVLTLLKRRKNPAEYTKT